MYPILALQALAVGLALLVTASHSPIEIETARHEPQHTLRAASPEPARMHCRLYFGCAPPPAASRASTE